VWILGAIEWVYMDRVLITQSDIAIFHFHPLSLESSSSKGLIVTPFLLKAKCNLGVPYLICVFNFMAVSGFIVHPRRSKDPQEEGQEELVWCR